MDGKTSQRLIKRVFYKPFFIFWYQFDAKHSNCHVNYPVNSILKLNLCSPVHRMAKECRWVADCIHRCVRNQVWGTIHKTKKHVVWPVRSLLDYLCLHSEYDNAVATSHPQNADVKIKNSTVMFFKNHWGHLLWIGIDYEPILYELKKFIGD